MERAGTSGRNQFVRAELNISSPVTLIDSRCALGMDGSASLANGDFGRELRVTLGKVILSATADVQKSPLARGILRCEPGIF